jgi:SAM-dependent methyltransferase
MDYNEIDPLEYKNRHLRSPREYYTHYYWAPIFERTIEKYCRNGTILDLGCGFGSSTKIVRRFNEKTIGIDIAYKWLSHAKKENPKMELIFADCKNIPLKTESVDVIVSRGLFEFVDRESTIQEISRILKDNGICIILVPNKYSACRFPQKIFSKIMGKYYGKNEPSKPEMLMLLREADLDIIEFRMDDGLIMLPNIIDEAIGLKTYRMIERVAKWRGENPFSNIMLLVGRKVDKKRLKGSG